LKDYSLNWHKGKILPNQRAIFTLFYFLLAYLAGLTQSDTLTFHAVNNAKLQQFEIRKIFPGKDGKLWLSTEKGLGVFDGNDVIFYNSPQELLNVSRIFADKQGNYYTVLVGGAIYYFNTRTGSIKLMDIKVASEDSSGFFMPRPYTEIFFDNAGIVWCGRINMGLLEYDASGNKTKVFSLKSSPGDVRNTVNSIRPDSIHPELLWLGTDNGIYSFNKLTGQMQRNFHSTDPSDSSVLDLVIFRIEGPVADTIWFTAAGRGVGCYAIRTGQYTMFPYRINSSAKDFIPLDLLFFQSRGRHEYYVGPFQSLPGIFNTQTRQYVFNTATSPKLPGLRINHVVADDFGNIWCIIFGQLYVARTHKDKLISVPVRDKVYKDATPNVFKTVIWDDKKQLYYAAFDNSDGVFVFDKNMKPLPTITAPSRKVNGIGVLEPLVFDIGLDINGRLWMCGEELTIYDSVHRKMIKANDLYPRLGIAGLMTQHMVFRDEYLYLVSLHPSSKSLYRINTRTFLCDSFPMPVTMLNKNGVNQFGVLVMDKKGENAYLSNKSDVFQWNLKDNRCRLVFSMPRENEAFNHFGNLHWYEMDDFDNIWIINNVMIRIFEPVNLKAVRRMQREKQTYLLQTSNVTNQGIMCFAGSTGLELYDYRNNKQFKLGMGDGLVTFFNSGVACVNNTLFTGADINTLQYMPLSSVINKNTQRVCYLSNIQLFNKPYATSVLPSNLDTLVLPYNKNSITLTFSSIEFQQPDRLEYRYKLDRMDEYWVQTNYLNRTISYNNLKPGKYVFYASVKNADGKWSRNKVKLFIIIIPAWWQTKWFMIASVIAICLLAYFFVRWRIKTVRQKERAKVLHEKALLELEAKALRAQMNPHFIFNCMNSIKSLIQMGEQNKAVVYLTTFSKLIRNIFQNSDKREITLYDEIETCKLYTHLESLRFGTKLNYSFLVDDSIDLKSVEVPALIIQPFIENAIWHGIMPKEEGGTVIVSVVKEALAIKCIIDDDGIGRELSENNKFKGERSSHQSKGVYLTQSRLDLDSKLREREAKVTVTDKKNELGKATGTTIIISFTDF
jgi:hypothetical protein